MWISKSSFLRPRDDDDRLLPDRLRDVSRRLRLRLLRPFRFLPAPPAFVAFLPSAASLPLDDEEPDEFESVLCDRELGRPFFCFLDLDLDRERDRLALFLRLLGLAEPERLREREPAVDRLGLFLLAEFFFPSAMFISFDCSFDRAAEFPLLFLFSFLETDPLRDLRRSRSLPRLSRGERLERLRDRSTDRRPDLDRRRSREDLRSRDDPRRSRDVARRSVRDRDRSRDFRLPLSLLRSPDLPRSDDFLRLPAVPWCSLELLSAGAECLLSPLATSGGCSVAATVAAAAAGGTFFDSFGTSASTNSSIIFSSSSR